MTAGGGRRHVQYWAWHNAGVKSGWTSVRNELTKKGHSFQLPNRRIIGVAEQMVIVKTCLHDAPKSEQKVKNLTSGVIQSS